MLNARWKFRSDKSTIENRLQIFLDECLQILFQRKICVFNQGKLSNNSLRRCYALYYVRETQNGTTGGDTFHNLIGASQGFVFSDPRDRVYGLLGLYTCDRAVRDQSLFIEPDYEATAMECFQIKE